jgi:hypothetical protein
MREGKSLIVRVKEREKSITADAIRDLFEYDPATGLLIWKPRTPSMFRGTAKRTPDHACANWNSRYAGKIAGSPNVYGHIRIAINKVLFQAHRIAFAIMNGRWPDELIDHKDSTRSNNSYYNIREATSSQNMANQRIRSDNISGFKGVSFDNRRRKWVAQIRKDKKHIFLGYFDSAESASIIYQEAAISLFGEFSRFG